MDILHTNSTGQIVFVQRTVALLQIQAIDDLALNVDDKHSERVAFNLEDAELIHRLNGGMEVRRICLLERGAATAGGDVGDVAALGPGRRCYRPETLVVM